MPESSPLFLITDGGPLRSRGRLLDAIESALAEGAGRISHLLLREQVIGSSIEPASDEELLKIISAVSATAQHYDCKVLVHNHLEIAQDSRVAGVHLGGPEANVQSAREVLGPDSLVGYSAHSESDICHAFGMGADYVFLSPVFSPTSKESDRPLIGVAELSRICAQSHGPVYALGGITVDSIRPCRDAGAAGVALIGYVFASSEPGSRIRALLSAWDS